MPTQTKPDAYVVVKNIAVDAGDLTHWSNCHSLSSDCMICIAIQSKYWNRLLDGIIDKGGRVGDG